MCEGLRIQARRGQSVTREDTAKRRGYECSKHSLLCFVEALGIRGPCRWRPSVAISEECLIFPLNSVVTSAPTPPSADPFYDRGITFPLFCFF